MPRNRKQGIVFGLLMSYIMAYGMEVYNIAIKHGIQSNPGGYSNLTDRIFLEALIEAAYMGIFVFITSNLWGNKIGAAFASKYTEPGSDNKYFCRLMRQAGTVAIMCPTMSLIASILFNVILGGAPVLQLPAIWVGTVIKNLPMAFFWNMFFAAPLAHKIFELLFPEKPEKAA